MAVGFVLPAALMAGGAIMQSRGQRQQQRARRQNVSDAMEAQRRWQDRSRERQDELLGEALEEGGLGREDLESDMKDRAAALAERIEANRAGGGFDASGPKYLASADDGGSGGGDSRAARAMQAARSARGEELGAIRDQQSEARNELDSLGMALSGRQITQQPYRDNMAMEVEFADRRAERLPLQVHAATEEARSAGRGSRQLGSILSGIGMGYATGGAGGAVMGGATSQQAAQRNEGQAASNPPPSRRR